MVTPNSKQHDPLPSSRASPRKNRERRERLKAGKEGKKNGNGEDGMSSPLPANRNNGDNENDHDDVDAAIKSSARANRRNKDRLDKFRQSPGGGHASPTAAATQAGAFASSPSPSPSSNAKGRRNNASSERNRKGRSKTGKSPNKAATSISATSQQQRNSDNQSLAHEKIARYDEYDASENSSSAAGLPPLPFMEENSSPSVQANDGQPQSSSRNGKNRAKQGKRRHRNNRNDRNGDNDGNGNNRRPELLSMDDRHYSGLTQYDSKRTVSAGSASSNQPGSVRQFNIMANKEKSTTSLPQADMIEVSLSDNDRRGITDAERYAIRQKAEEDARRKIATTTVLASTIVDGDDEPKTSSATKRRCWIIVIIAVLVVAAIIAGAVVGTQSGNKGSSSSSNEGAPSIITAQPTESPIDGGAFPTPTFQPLPEGRECSAEFHGRCECAIEIARDSIADPIVGDNFDSEQDLENVCDDIIENGFGVWYKIRNDDDASGGSLPQSRLMTSLCQPVTILDDTTNLTREVETDFDTQISVFLGERCDQLSCVASNDQGGIGCGDQSRTSFLLNFGQNPANSYYLYVHGFRSSRGTFALQMRELPSNFNCNQAVDLVLNTALYGTTEGANVIPPEIGNCLNAVSTAPGVWYRHVEPLPGPGELSGGLLPELQIRVTPVTDGFVPQLSLFKGASCDSMSCLAGSVSRLSFEPQEGNTYYLLVHGLVDTFGDYTVELTYDGQEAQEVEPNRSTCDSPVGIPIGETLVQDQLLALTDEVNQIASCADAVLIATEAGSPNAAYRGVWFNTTGAGGILRASTCNSKTRTDTQIHILMGDSCTELVCVDANDDATTFNFSHGSTASLEPEPTGCSSVAWFAEDGVDYKILVHISGERPPTRSSAVELSLEEVDRPPVSTSCSGARSIPIDGTSIAEVAVQSSSSSDVPPCASSQDADDSAFYSWYTYEGDGQRMTASTCHVGASDEFSTTIHVLGSLDGSCENVECVDSSDQYNSVVLPCNNGHMSITWDTFFGQKYFVVVQLAATNEPTEAVQATFALTVERSPLNDKCPIASKPILVDSGDNMRIATTRSATRTNIPSCPLSEQLPLVPSTGRDVWFSVIGNGFEMIASTNSIYSQFAADLDVYVGDGCDQSLPCVDPSIVTKSSDGSVPSPSGYNLQWLSESGKTYSIRVSGLRLELDHGVVALTVAPANGRCSRASEVALSSGGDGQSISTVRGTTKGATPYTSCRFENPFRNSPGVWYKVQGTGSEIIARTCSTPSGFPTHVSVATAADGRFVKFRDCPDQVCLSSSSTTENITETSCGVHHSVSWLSSLDAVYFIMVQSLEQEFELQIEVES
eukprot:CAMPEP_0119548888 /NCGR_PEP_ID=MMETSP1352-20130426/2710_1 /TAXON_ID=265584 /ORGANISM="Stauroneis constricta, Strain CCMP1120" /LENGTH=1341 /DNA_ID=CAMNT_0007594291 /DNA_START=109 /DNA_END=4134 /DNA_ORIENTATION=+